MKAATMFSGIGAPEMAMPHWDWLWHAEIEPFPSAVMAARHPGSVNLGDVSAPDFVERAIDAGRPDVLVFGSPCQSFSVAGRRLGLDDPRGNLALVALGLAQRLRPEWLVFENVPGLLSSNRGDDFAAFLSVMGQCGYFGAWRVLDAQYAGVPQRRRRVFFVGHLGDWRRAAAVLFEPASLRGDPPPRRAAGQGVAPSLAARTRGGGGLGTDSDLDGGLIASTGRQWPAEVASTLNAHYGDKWGLEDQHALNGAELFVPAVTHTLRGDGFDASEDGAGRGTPLVPVAFHPTQDPISSTDGTTHCLGTGSKQGAATVAVAFSCKDHGADAGDLAPTLRAMSHGATHANGGGRVAVGISIADAVMAGVNSTNNVEPPDADAEEVRPGKVLRELREAVGAEAFCRWGSGVLSSFQQTEVLRRDLLQQVAREGAVGREVERSPLDVKESSGAGTMCSLWEAGCSRRPSQEWRLAGRLARELGAYLSGLPQQGAPPAWFLQDMRGAAEGAWPLREALSADEEAWRPSGVQDPAEEGLSNLRGTGAQREPVRQTLHAAETRHAFAVRRLTPREAERLQGFPDDFTLVPFRNKLAADGPRYKALGNSMAVPVIRWILQRLEKVASS